ncbi:nascent polypeptide-associated complex protein [Acidianus sp. HS-5]|uniref:nascent polypeptide-associated complex protein n=1 Tax=Acidianus sp. HS-5 TaxID=2886040 RepID=UPI001F0BE6E1|nr:nascent polypeptide-associated complex protein [Acidianus sp. HS-5]BDC17129.1 NagC family transcriptional regulator [Acidianus sp. HS-5]
MKVPKDLKALQRMGIKAEKIDALRVTIETADEIITIESPMVMRTSVGGQEAIVVSGGETKVEKKNSQKVEVKDEDVKFVMEQTGKPENEVKEALIKANGDIAKAIMILNGQES